MAVTGASVTAHAGTEDLLEGVSLAKYFHQRTGALGRSVLVRAVHEATIGVAAGETVGLVGESGSGKSTLGRLLLRLLEPSYGSVWFEGREITFFTERELRPLRRRMQPLFQDAAAALDGRLRVDEIVMEPLRIHGSRGGELDDRARASFARVGLPMALAKRRPAELSSGERQRVSLARALALEPRVLVCDEPVASLDPSEQLAMMEQLLELSRSLGLAHLFISHDLRLVLGSSERVYVMYAGRIVEAASSDVLRHGARHPYTRALLHALPSLDPRRRRLRVVVEGEPPSPFQPVEGCAFHPRCPRARSGVCNAEAPPLAPIGEAGWHDVACWYPYD